MIFRMRTDNSMPEGQPHRGSLRNAIQQSEKSQVSDFENLLEPIIVFDELRVG